MDDVYMLKTTLYKCHQITHEKIFGRAIKTFPFERIYIFCPETLSSSLQSQLSLSQPSLKLFFALSPFKKLNSIFVSIADEEQSLSRNVKANFLLYSKGIQC